MGNKNILIQAIFLYLLILANFIAQIPYFFHLYYHSQSLISSSKSFLIMGAVFLFFLTASIFTFTRHRIGYPLLLIFLAAEFLFYLWNTLGTVMHGYALFFQIYNPDLLLRIVYSIGYVNLFASGYFIFLLLRYKSVFQNQS
jgi:hypothetical protein